MNGEPTADDTTAVLKQLKAYKASNPKNYADVSKMSSIDRMTRETSPEYPQSRGIKIDTLKNDAYESLKSKIGSDKIGELSDATGKHGLVHNGAIYVNKNIASSNFYPVAHEIGHLISSKMSSEELQIIGNELPTLTKYLFDKVPKKDVSSYKYITSDTEVLADAYAMYSSSSGADKIRKVAPEIASMFDKYESTVLSNLKNPKPLDEASIAKYSSKAKGYSKEEMMVRNQYKEGEKYGWDWNMIKQIQPSANTISLYDIDGKSGVIQVFMNDNWALAISRDGLVKRIHQPYDNPKALLDAKSIRESSKDATNQKTQFDYMSDSVKKEFKRLENMPSGWHKSTLFNKKELP